MRNGLIIFAIGFVLGSTLGFGGMWTQVVVPAKEEIEKLEHDHGVLKDAVDMAADALRKAVDELRSEAGPEPADVRDAIAPSQPGPTRFTRTLRIADELESKASLLEETRRARSR